jgi:hypothetical protein
MKNGRVFESILVKYKRAWKGRDPRLAIELFTPDATYGEDPFDVRPMRGLREIEDYWAKVPRFQKNIRLTHGPVFRLGQPGFGGRNGPHAALRFQTRESIRLRGVMFCELRGDKIRRFWEYWHVRGGEPSFRVERLETRGW